MQILKQSYQSLAATISVKAKGSNSAACLLAQAPIRCEAAGGIHSAVTGCGGADRGIIPDYLQEGQIRAGGHLNWGVRAIVHNDHFQSVPPRLYGDAVQRSLQLRRAIAGRDDDGYERGF